jgi:nicotinate-nucleotide pyrophosphorylase (carboxylating)
MDTAQLADAVKYARSLKDDIILEASGNITLDNVREKALTGVDIISSGAITHSYRSSDLSMKIVQVSN